MYFPIKAFITPESFLKVQLSLPVFVWFRTGFRPNRVVGQDRKWFPQMTCMTGKAATCLHFYILAISFRIRSNSIMKKIREDRQDKNIKRFLVWKYQGWQQAFESAII